MFEESRSVSVKIAPLLKSTALVVRFVVRERRTTSPLAGAGEIDTVLAEAKVKEVETPLTKAATSDATVYVKGTAKVVVLPFAVYSI